MKDRIQIEYPSTGVEIRIAARRSALMVGALGLFLLWFADTFGWWIRFLISRVVEPDHLGELVVVSLFLFFFLGLFIAALGPVFYWLGWLLYGKEAIRFRHKGQEHRFGWQLDPEEAGQLLMRLRTFLPETAFAE